MSWLRHNAKPEYTALQLQTSVSILPIPILWGQTKVSPNLIWYGNFQAVSGSGGKGIGGKGGLVSHGSSSNSASNYTYKADIMMALCEGPIQGIGLIWKDLSVYTLPALGLGFYPGDTPQSVWPYLQEFYPFNALAYQGTAYVWGGGYNLGSTAAIGNHNFEVYGILRGSGVNGIDADPAQVVNDFLTNAQYGCGFNPASIDGGSLFTNPDSFQAYCAAMGFAFSPCLTSQEQASSILARWLQIFTTAAVWSGGLLKFIPYADTAIAQGDSLSYSTQLSIPIPTPIGSGEVLPSVVTVSTPTAFVADGGVAYAFSNVPLTFIGASVPSVAGEYGMTVPGAYIFGPADQGKPVVITYTLGAAGNFAPNLTPLYELTDSDFIDEKGNKDPLQVERADVFSLPTVQRIEVSSRSNQYAATPVEARDQAQVETFGVRVGSVIQAHEICDEFVMGPRIAQTILQRELYVRTKFTFKVSWEYCLLDPMDVITITDTNLGLTNYPVRVIQIEEDDKGLLSVTCEELVTGVSTPAYNPSAGAGGFQPNQAVPAVPVNAPLIVQPPLGLTGNVAQIWVGASGISSGSSAQWGGAFVWASVDDVTYSQVAMITAPMRQGSLTAALGAAAGWDVADTLSVSLAESGGALAGTTEAAAQAGATLSLVDNEFLAYETATLVSANAYNLSGLARGLGGSPPTAHSTGAPFYRIDGAVVRYDMPANFAGRELFFKFQSFNIFGAGVQDLSTCAVYTFNAPAAASDPIFAQVQTGFGLDLGQIESAVAVSDDFGSVSVTASNSLDLGAIVVVVVHPIAVQLLSSVPLDLGLITGGATVSDNFGSVNDAVVDFINLGTVP
jgi:hypothetical protein